MMGSKKIAIALSALLLALNPAKAEDQLPYVTLDDDMVAELLADWPNAGWGPQNQYISQLVKLEDNLFTYANKNNTRTFFLVTEEGVVVADPISSEDARILRDLISQVTDKPVTHVLYSHHHWDHVTGAQIFKDEGATIYAHERARQRIIERGNPLVVVPDVGFYGDYILDVGSERIDMRYYGPNHSDSLMFMLLKNGKYLFLVDVVSPGAVPWGIIPDTDFHGTVQTLLHLERLDFEMVIPGHGVPIAPRSALVERRLYVSDLINAVEAELAEDGFQQDFYENVEAKMQKWSHMRGFDWQFRMNLETMLYYIGIGE